MKEYNTSENTWELIENLNSCKNTSALWEGGDKIKLSKVVWHVIKSWNKVSGWGVSSSSSLSLLIFFNRQSFLFSTILSLTQFCVIKKALQRGELVLLQFEESLTSAYCEHSLVILTSHSHEWPWWVHSAHLKCDFIITQRIEWLKQ
jgi:hypothetical protein